jgi:hypothetical protein
VALSRWQTAAAITFIAVLALAFAPSAAFARDGHEAASLATVTAVHGDVFVLHIDGGSGLASAGDVVAAGDAIRTAPGSFVELTYVEGSSVRTGESTAFVVEGLAVEPDQGAVLGMWRAAVRTWRAITTMVSGGSRYEVRAPASSASVRG